MEESHLPTKQIQKKSIDEPDNNNLSDIELDEDNYDDETSKNATNTKEDERAEIPKDQQDTVRPEPHCRVECDFAGTVTQFTCCNQIGVKIRVMLICAVEMLAISYQLTTSILIYIRPNNDYLKWYTQPFMALVWFQYPSLLFWLNMILMGSAIISIICLLQALESNNSKLVFPHIVMQIILIILLIVLAVVVFVVYTPNTQSQYARRVADLTGSTMGSGLAGIGNVIYGLEKYKQNQIRNHPKISRKIPLNNNNTKKSAIKRKANGLKHKRINDAEIFSKIWTVYDDGIVVLVAIITFLTTALIEILFLVIILQCYYYLMELRKTARLVQA